MGHHSIFLLFDLSIQSTVLINLADDWIRKADLWVGCNLPTNLATNTAQLDSLFTSNSGLNLWLDQLLQKSLIVLVPAVVLQGDAIRVDHALLRLLLLLLLAAGRRVRPVRHDSLPTTTTTTTAATQPTQDLATAAGMAAGVAAQSSCQVHTWGLDGHSGRTVSACRGCRNSRGTSSTSSKLKRVKTEMITDICQKSVTNKKTNV